MYPTMPKQITKQSVTRGRISEETQLNVSWGFINRTEEVVFVQDRSGVSFHIQPEVGYRFGNERVFIIRKTYRWNPAYVAVDRENILKELSTKYDTQLELSKQLSENVTSNGIHKTLCIDFCYSYDELRKSNVRYCGETDYMFGLPRPSQFYPHPYSPLGTYYRMMLEEPHTTPYSHWYAYIVDNRGNSSSKFINLLGAVYEIKPRLSQHERDGLYMVRSHFYDESGDVVGTPRVTRISLDDLSSCDFIFRTYEEAYHYGDPAVARERLHTELEHQRKMMESEHKAQISIMQYELEELKMETAKQKNIIEREQSYHNLEVTKATSEIKFDHEVKSNAEKLNHQSTKNRLDMELIESKSTAERNSIARKDTSDGLKFVAPIVGAAVGVAIKKGLEHYNDS